MLLLKMPKSRQRVVLAAHANEGEILREFEVDEAENKMVIHSTQDVEPILNDNKRVLASHDGRYRSDTLNRVASVPNIIIEKWMRMGINAYDKADTPKILAMLDSPEYAYLRTAPGRLSRRPVRHFMRASTPSGSRIARANGSLSLKTS